MIGNKMTNKYKAGDVIGYAPVTVTPDMVGKTLAVFVNIEVKRPDYKTHPAHLQKQWDFIQG